MEQRGATNQETLQKPQKLAWSHFKINKKDIYEPRVFAPSLVMMLLVFSFGTTMTVFPDMSDHLGLENRGTIFTYFILSSLLIRLVAGKISDKYGRILPLKIGALSYAISMTMLAFVSTELMFIVSSIIYGIAVGIASPTLFAWTIDLSHKQHVARGMSTMFIALEIGIGFGALLTGWIYANNLDNLFHVFMLAATSSSAALLFLFYHSWTRKWGGE